MKRPIVLGDGFALPLEAATQTFAILGKRGVGKTHCAAVMAEGMLDQGIQVGILDPIGVWWGLRSSADGKAKGFPILVLGGDHGDLPLEAGSGRLVADFMVAKRASAVLDLGLLSKSDQARFVTDYLERLYQVNRAPLHLMLDEADSFAPQRLHPGAQRCFGAVDTVTRRGRARGLGVTLVTQRSAAINKDVLTQAEVLVSFRTIAPQDRAAIEAWVEVHGDERGRKAMLSSLHELAIGECWVWSPAWLEQLSRVRIRRRRTFDSSKTPEVGKSVAAPKTVAAVDIEAFRAELGALVEKATQEDPRRLRMRIGELERELAKKPVAMAPAAKIERREVPVLRKGELEKLERLRAGYAALVDRLDRMAMGLNIELVKLDARLEPIRRAREGTPRIIPRIIPNPTQSTGPRAVALPEPTPAAYAKILQARHPERPRTAARGGAGADGSRLAGGERRILTALAQYPAGRTLRQVALLTGYAIGGGGFNNYLGALRSRGLLEGGREAMRITEPGRAALGDFDPLPTGRALLNHWLGNGHLGKAERAVLEALASRYPDALDKETLASATGYTADGGGFNNALGRLRTLELIQGRGELRASAELFE